MGKVTMDGRGDDGDSPREGKGTTTAHGRRDDGGSLGKDGESIADKGRDYGAWAREATVQRMMEPRWGTATVDGGGDVDGGRSIDEGVRGRW